MVFFVDFGPFRTTSGPSWQRGRGDGVSATSRPRDAIDAPREGTETLDDINQHRPLLRGPGRRVAAGGPARGTTFIWRSLSSSGAPRTVRRRLQRVVNPKKRKSPICASDASSTTRRPGHRFTKRRRRHGLVRGAGRSGGAGPRRLPQRRLGADGPRYCR